MVHFIKPVNIILQEIVNDVPKIIEQMRRISM